MLQQGLGYKLNGPARPRVTGRPNPADGFAEPGMHEQERRHVARLMRINHTGEVCAQALYQGQAFTARQSDVQNHMEHSAREESDHLSWCEPRLDDLEDHKSYLNPFWYADSFAIGALAGIAGDRWSLGFIVETERQVESHLDGHLEQIPSQVQKTRAILEQMKSDGIHHADVALADGGAPLPAPRAGGYEAGSQVHYEHRILDLGVIENRKKRCSH